MQEFFGGNCPFKKVDSVFLIAVLFSFDVCTFLFECLVLRYFNLQCGYFYVFDVGIIQCGYFNEGTFIFVTRVSLNVFSFIFVTWVSLNVGRCDSVNR